MAITYAWRCKFCGGNNNAGPEVCATCGKPAIVRPIDVDAGAPIEPVKPTMKISPPILNAIFIVLVVVALCGAVLERFAFGIRAELACVAVVVGAGLPAWIIWKLAAEPISESQEGTHDA